MRTTIIPPPWNCVFAREISVYDKAQYRRLLLPTVNKPITIVEARYLTFRWKKKKKRKKEEERNESQKVRETRSPDHDTNTFFTTKFARDLFINHNWKKCLQCCATCASKISRMAAVNDGFGMPDKLIRCLRRVILKIFNVSSIFMCSTISRLRANRMV